MSVSLREVIEAGGYNLDTAEDCRWLLSREEEFEDLKELAIFINGLIVGNNAKSP